MQKKQQGTRQLCVKKGSDELGKKVYKKGSKKIGKKLCKEGSEEIGKRV